MKQDGPAWPCLAGALIRKGLHQFHHHYRWPREAPLVRCPLPRPPKEPCGAGAALTRVTSIKQVPAIAVKTVFPLVLMEQLCQPAPKTSPKGFPFGDRGPRRWRGKTEVRVEPLARHG